MKQSTKITIYFVFAAGIVSIVGDVLIRLTSHLVSLALTGKMLLPWRDIFLNPGWMALDFLAGVVTGVIFAPFFVHKILATIGKQGNWLMQGAGIGAAAGFCNVIISAAIHLSIMAGLGMQEEAWTTMAQKLFQIYLPIAVIVQGIPGAAVGALAGIGGGFFLKRFALLEGSTAGN